MRAHQSPDPADKLRGEPVERSTGHSGQNQIRASVSFIGRLYYTISCKTRGQWSISKVSTSMPISQPEQSKDMVPPRIPCIKIPSLQATEMWNSWLKQWGHLLSRTAWSEAAGIPGLVSSVVQSLWVSLLLFPTLPAAPGTTSRQDSIQRERKKMVSSLVPFWKLRKLQALQWNWPELFHMLIPEQTTGRRRAEATVQGCTNQNPPLDGASLS